MSQNLFSNNAPTVFDLLAVVCHKKDVNQNFNPFVKDQLGRIIFNNLFEKDKTIRSLIIDFYIHYSTPKNIDQTSLQKISETKIEPEFLYHLFGDFTCNTVALISHHCIDVKRWLQVNSVETNLTNIIWHYYNKNFCMMPGNTTITHNTSFIATGHNIPNIIHHVWATSVNKAKQLSKKYLQIVENNMQIADATEFILWVNDKSILRSTVNQAEQSGMIVNEFTELNIWNKIAPYVEQAIRHFQYGIVTDLMRYAVLFEKGGMYLDLDYKLVNDVKPLLLYDFFVMNFDSGTSNSFLGAKPQHTLIRTTIDLSLHSLNQVMMMLPYPQECFGRCNIGFATAGPTSLKTAYQQIANHNTYDIQIPLLLAENDSCHPSYICIKNEINELLQDLLEYDYCFGYSVSHHEGGGASWCVGY